jgi:hypothetical protein
MSGQPSTNIREVLRGVGLCQVLRPNTHMHVVVVIGQPCCLGHSQA